MHILFITSSNSASGGARQALYLASGLRERGHTVHFFSPSRCTLRLLAPDLSWRDLPASFWGWKEALESAMPPGEPVIAHAFHNKAVKALACFGTLWRLTGRPVACVAHRGVVYRPRNILPYIAPGIRVFAVNSQACLDTLPLLWRKNAGRVVYNCVPDDKVTPGRSVDSVRAELGVTPTTDILGFVGNNAPVKGVEVLLRAFARLRADGSVLCLVGITEEEWSPLCRELGIAERVRFIPRTEAVADYLQVFTLFVLPSLSESSPNTLLEAMRMGLPAVCSKVGGVPECIRDERRLVPPGDAASLAAAMDAALADREGLAESARRNKEDSRRFSVAAKLDAMEAIYAELLTPFSAAAKSPETF